MAQIGLSSRRLAGGSVRWGHVAWRLLGVLVGGCARRPPAEGIACLLPLVGDGRQTGHDLLVKLLRGWRWGGFGGAVIGSRGRWHRPLRGARIGAHAAHGGLALPRGEDSDRCAAWCWCSTGRA